ncbi:hypothetical protein DV736_g5139, partial [Chaetothyriales sp. CBS 134916]
MPFSHHSHSGQFCPGHASNTLEQVVQTAIAKGLRVFGLTEHMPRHYEDQYPEEREAGFDPGWHLTNEAAYIQEALRLRDKYKSEIVLPLGFECDWIRPESRALIERSISTHPYDYFVGSVHHVHTVPIDYDAAMYADAKQKAGGTDERLFEDYFDAQLDMLEATRPPVVGHFDLIRLKSTNPDGSFKSMSGVWERIIRNLKFVASYGGILEINTAALRKGMREPYPNHEICQRQAALRDGIRFCLSDDSHGVAQVAYGYSEALHFLKRCGIRSLCYLTHCEDNAEVVDSRFPRLLVSEIQVADLHFISNNSSSGNKGTII